MATLTINNSNKPTAMRLRLTYTAGQGNITITKIEGCRTDSYGDTTDAGTCSVKIKVGSLATRTYSKTGVYFKDNSEYTTILQQNISFDVTGTQSVNITFTSANSNINGSSFTTSINAGVKAPTLTINNATSSSRLNITTSGATLNYTLANTNSLSTTLQYYVGSWKTFETKSANGTYNYAITSAQTTEILTYLNNTATPNLQLRANNSNGASSSVYAYLSVDSSIVPTLSSISVSAYCNVSGFENLFVKGLSKPIITFNGASGVQGSTISSYLVSSLTGDERTNFVLSMNDNVSNTSNFNNLSVDGTNTIVAYVKDSRSRSSATKSQTFNVIDYNTPSINSISLRRCLQDGTLSEDGTYALLNMSYKVYPVNDGTTDKNTKYLAYKLNGQVVAQIGITNWEDTIELVIGNGQFDTAQTYEVEFILQDRTSTTTQSANIAPSKKLRSLYHGNDGEGITLGRKASEPGFHDYLGATFHNGLNIEDINVEDALFFKSGDTLSFTDMVEAGFLTTGKTQAIFTIVLPKSMENVSVSITGFVAQIRNNNNYILGTGTTKVAPSSLNVSKSSEYHLKITCNLASATSGATNNDACGIAFDCTINFN